jgi:hypothetical protein
MSSCYCFSFNRCAGVSSRSFQSAYSQKRTWRLLISQWNVDTVSLDISFSCSNRQYP